MKKTSKIILVTLIILIIILIVAGMWLLFSNLDKTNKRIEELENNINHNSSKTNLTTNNIVNELNGENLNVLQTNIEIENQTKKDNVSVNNIEESNLSNNAIINNNDNIVNIWIGEYLNSSQTENYYHQASVEFKNQKENTIDFYLSAAHGRDIEHVNIGEASGTAKKISSKINLNDGETEYDTYLFEDNIDGKIYKITFIFNAHKLFKWVEVKQDFPEDINPYAGHNVNFEGEYEKIK